MSILPKAPLVEVIFEIRWDSSSNEEMEKFQFLIGAMRAELINDYPEGLHLTPDSNIPLTAFMNSPVFRFKNIQENLLYQIGPGLLSINCVDVNYDWGMFSKEVYRIVDVFKKLYPIAEEKKVNIALKYLDFFEVDPVNNNLFAYLKTNFNLDINAAFFKQKQPLTLGLATSYQVEQGVFNLSINTGKINNPIVNKSGFIVESSISNTEKARVIFENIEFELNNSHSYLSDFFKNLTEGNLYESFK